MGKWGLLLMYIRVVGVGETFSRKGLFRYMELNARIQNTADSYRRYLTKAGYLEWVSRGRYRVKGILPLGTSLLSIKKKAYPNSFRKREEVTV